MLTQESQNDITPPVEVQVTVSGTLEQPVKPNTQTSPCDTSVNLEASTEAQSVSSPVPILPAIDSILANVLPRVDPGCAIAVVPTANETEDSSGQADKRIQDQDEGSAEPNSLTVALPAHRMQSPEIPGEILAQSRLGDAQRSTMQHKSKDSMERYNKEFNQGIEKVRQVCMAIAEATGKKYHLVEADMFAAMQKPQKRAVRVWDVYITKELEKRNKERDADTPAWTRVEVQQDKKVRVAYAKLSAKEEEALIQEGEELRELKSKAKKWGPARTQAIWTGIDKIHERLTQLYISTGVIGMALFCRSNSAINFDATAVTGFDDIDGYFESIYRITPEALAGDMDLWACNQFRVGANSENMTGAEKRRSFRHAVKQLLLKALGISRGTTNEVDNIGWADFCQTEVKNSVRLVGYDPTRIKAPSSMAIGDIDEFMSGIDNGTIYFKVMSPSELLQYKNDLKAKGVKEKLRKKRADAGTKRQTDTAREPKSTHSKQSKLTRSKPPKLTHSTQPKKKRSQKVQSDTGSEASSDSEQSGVETDETQADKSTWEDIPDTLPSMERKSAAKRSLREDEEDTQDAPRTKRRVNEGDHGKRAGVSDLEKTSQHDSGLVTARAPLSEIESNAAPDASLAAI